MIKWMLLLISLTTSISHASLLDSLNNEPEFLPVELAFPLTTEQEGATLSAHWNSSDGYYLYKSRIYVSQNGQRIEANAWSQSGKQKQDEAFGQVTAFYGPLTASFDLSTLQPGTYTLHHQGCADAGLCYPPQKLQLSWDGSTAANASSPQPQSSIDKTSATTQPDSDDWFSGRSWGAVVGLFFLLGLGLTFTPCVLPMVPILTSVVLGQGNHSPTRGFVLSSVYVLGMALTYAAAGLTVGLLGAGANIQAWMQTPWVLIVFAALFAALALAMFGVYELQLPAGLRNRLNDLNQRQQGGHLVSVFIMGVLSALVVSPCVSAPLAGALVYLGATGDAWLGGSALLALGLGMGAPLIVLGTTGASILPKAGMWMNQIKAVFGVLLLGVAIWLLSRILPAAIELALWGTLTLMYGIYLGALEPANSGGARVVKGIALIFTLYGASALLGALQGNDNPLQPLSSSHSNVSTTVSQHLSPFQRTASVAEIDQLIASSSGPVMVDLYADWCISCKVMEKEVFEQADVQQLLSDTLWLQLDVTDNTDEHIEFMQRYGVFGPPTVLFFNQGQELASARLPGEAHKAGFIQHIEQRLRPAL